MRVAMDFLLPSNAAGAPVPTVDAAVGLGRPAAVPGAVAADGLVATPFSAATDAPAHGRLGRHLWRADDLPADTAVRARTSGFAALDAELPGGGWPQGQLVELLVDAPGLGELSLLAPALAAVSAERRACVWVLPVHEGRRPAARVSAVAPLPYAPALQAAGIAPAHCMFVQPATPRESGWALEQALRASHLGAVIGWLPETLQHGSDADFRALRRLHLLAAQQRALVFVLRSTRHAHAPSPAALRLQLAQHDGRLQVQVLKRRGRPLLDPVALQVHPEAWRAARVAPPLAAEPVEVPVPLARRQAQDALAQREQRWSLKALFSH
jgi:cell division inhibitor SulA/protein ImuA